MPFTADEQTQNYIKQNAKNKWACGDDAQAKVLQTMVQLMPGKKKAIALLDFLPDYVTFKLLAKYYDLAEVNLQNWIAATATANQNKLRSPTIEAEFSTLNNNVRNHMGGTPVNTPVQSSGVTQAVHYNNGEAVLPAGLNYIEWYLFVASQRSAQKRFFTARGDQRVWYTDGGTHQANLRTVPWWVRVAQGVWQKRG